MVRIEVSAGKVIQVRNYAPKTKVEVKDFIIKIRKNANKVVVL